jgi:hypothetical protein
LGARQALAPLGIGQHQAIGWRRVRCGDVRAWCARPRPHVLRAYTQGSEER